MQPKAVTSIVPLWGLSSTHIHGTHVPAEEPSTASEADIGVWRPSDILGMQKPKGPRKARNISIKMQARELPRNARTAEFASFGNILCSASTLSATRTTSAAI